MSHGKGNYEPRLESHLHTIGMSPPYVWKAISLRLGLDAPTAKVRLSIRTGGQGYLTLNSAGVTTRICEVEILSYQGIVFFEHRRSEQVLIRDALWQTDNPRQLSSKRPYIF